MAARRVNLLPRELLVRRRQRQRVVAIIATAAGVIALLVGMFVVQSIRLASERNKLEAQEQENRSIQVEISKLAEFERLKKEVDAKKKLVDGLTTDEVRWSVLLADISFVIPSDAWLTSFTGTVAESTGTRKGATEGPLGTVQMNGVTFTHVDVAKWLTRLSQVEGFANPYLTLSSKGEIGETEIVNFNSTVELSERAFRVNQAGAGRRLI